jgi:hypothetical protein
MGQKAMIKTIEAVIDREGNVRLLEPVRLASSHRAVVVILEESPATLNETAFLSEESLKDWNRPEEDQAWSHLQSVK